MGAYASYTRSDGPTPASSDGLGGLLSAAFNMAAGGLWFSPGAFQHDVMMTLCDPGEGRKVGAEWNESSDGTVLTGHHPTFDRT